MLEFGADKSPAGDVIKDVNEDTFMADVIDTCLLYTSPSPRD